MKYLVFAIRDRATDQFGNPMVLVNQGQAIRSFSDEVNRDAADNMLCKHSDDFDLYMLGSYNSDSGLFETGVPEMIAIGKSLKLKE